VTALHRVLQISTKSCVHSCSISATYTQLLHCCGQLLVAVDSCCCCCQLHARGAGGTGVLPPMAACWSTINNIIASGEAIVIAENSLKTFGRSGLRPEPRRGNSQRSTRPHSWWGGGCCLLPKKSTPLSVFGPSVLASPPTEKSWACAWLLLLQLAVADWWN